MTRFWWFFLPALSLLFVPRGALALDHVVLQLKWQHQFQFAGYYAAIAKGYYREAGLEVELREARHDADPSEEVLAGRANFGVATSNLLLLRGQGKPVVVLAVIYQHSPFVLLASRQPEVQDVHGLAGKPLMMEPDAAELLAYFKSEGVDPAKLQLLPHDFGVQDLLSGRVAAMSAYSTDEPFHLKQAGIDYLIFTPRAGGIDFYGDNLFTTEKEIRHHPGRVKAFLDASLRGWNYAMAHPVEMIDLIQRDYPRGKTREQLLFEAEETAKLVHPELIELGHINPGRWESIARTYEDLGMLRRDFPLKGFIYDRHPRLDLRRLYWLAGGLAAVVVGTTGWMLLIWRLNRNLRGEVQARKQAEEKARKESAAKTHVFAVLAHEVRAPLAGILSALWLYRGSKSEEEREEIIGSAESSATSLLRMVDNILDHSKLEAGHMQAESLPVSLEKFLAEICSLFGAVATAKAIGLRHEIDPATPPVIITDPMRLRQILSNLLSNAVKFTAAGSVRLSVSGQPLRENFCRVIFRVSDSGPGISPEQMSRIFEPYAQADISVSRRFGGTGLGLSISSQLARLLGGSLTVESVPGGGATFVLALPAGTVPEEK